MGVSGWLRRRLERPYDVVSPAEAAELVRGGAVLLDVRTPGEWAAGRAPKARHLPLATLPSGLAELPTDRKVVVVCRSGNRSARAAGILARAGYDAANLAGGMAAWARAGLPVVTTGGRPGRVA